MRQVAVEARQVEVAEVLLQFGAALSPTLPRALDRHGSARHCARCDSVYKCVVGEIMHLMHHAMKWLRLKVDYLGSNYLHVCLCRPQGLASFLDKLS